MAGTQNKLERVLDWFLTIEAPRRYRVQGEPTRHVQNLRALTARLLAFEIPAERLGDRTPTRTAIGRSGRPTDAGTVRAMIDLDINDLLPADLRDWLEALAHSKVRGGGASGGRPISLTTVNKYRTDLLTMLRWASDEEQRLMDPAVLARLDRVKPIQLGRTPARRPKKVTSMPQKHLAALVAWSRRHADTMPVRNGRERLWQRNWRLFALAMEVMWESGMRPSELVCMRPCDLILSPDREAWMYTPPRQKTEHHGEVHVIQLMATAQMALREALELQRTDHGQHLLAFARSHTDQDRIFPWYQARQPAGGLYHKMVKAIELARAAGVAILERYTPHQLRHAFITRAAAVNVEGARVHAGHKQLSTTMRYIDKDLALARRTLEQMGA